MQDAPGQLLPEVVEFDAYEEEYGPTASWHATDHAEFLKILKACKGDYSAVVLRCVDCMIGFERQDIIAHARWHAQYEEKLFRKKAAVREWRESKAAAAAAAQEDALNLLQSNGDSATSRERYGAAFYFHNWMNRHLMLHSACFLSKLHEIHLRNNNLLNVVFVEWTCVMRGVM